jgi:hypothetical protein
VVVVVGDITSIDNYHRLRRRLVSRVGAVGRLTIVGAGTSRRCIVNLIGGVGQVTTFLCRECGWRCSLIDIAIIVNSGTGVGHFDICAGELIFFVRSWFSISAALGALFSG